MIARRMRDVVRGLIGTYVIEQRLVELRDAMRDLSGNCNVPVLVKNEEAPLQRIPEMELQAQLKAIETRLQEFTALAAHAIVRDVGILVYFGFPMYFFRHDVAFKGSMVNGPGPYVDISLERARNLIAERIANRHHSSISGRVRSFWSTFSKHDYNQIHTPLLAALHEAGVPADFVDVGANVGDTAVAAAELIELLGINSAVHSLEPGPVFELARANVALNQLDHRAVVHNVAATDVSGYLPMQILIGHTESGSLGNISSLYNLPLGETRFVRAVRLDEFLPADGRPYLIKIDAEGVDFAVVRGARALIDSGRAPIVTLEFTPKYNSAADLETARELLRNYALFNLRGLDLQGFFDHFDLVPENSFKTWTEAVAACPHGWTDVVFILNRASSCNCDEVVERTRNIG